MAGIIAEKRLTGRRSWIGAHIDLVAALGSASTLMGDEELGRFVGKLSKQTEKLIYDSPRWIAVKALAAEILLCRKMEGGKPEGSCLAIFDLFATSDCAVKDWIDDPLDRYLDETSGQACPFSHFWYQQERRSPSVVDRAIAFGLDSSVFTDEILRSQFVLPEHSDCQIRL